MAAARDQCFAASNTPTAAWRSSLSRRRRLREIDGNRCRRQPVSGSICSSPGESGCLFRFRALLPTRKIESGFGSRLFRRTAEPKALNGDNRDGCRSDLKPRLFLAHAGAHSQHRHDLSTRSSSGRSGPSTGRRSLSAGRQRRDHPTEFPRDLLQGSAESLRSAPSGRAAAIRLLLDARRRKGRRAGTSRMEAFPSAFSLATDGWIRAISPEAIQDQAKGLLGMRNDESLSDPGCAASGPLLRRIEELEAALAEYVQRYGFTDRARAAMIGGDGDCERRPEHRS